MIRFLGGNVDLAAVDTAVEQAFEDYGPGVLLGSASRDTSFISATTPGDITALSVGPITGKGRPVEVRFHCWAVWHATANTLVRVDLKANGTVFGSGQVSSTSTTNGPSLSFTEQITLTDGVAYTFTCSAFNYLGSGNMTFFAAASPARLTRLSVVSR